MQKLLTTSVFIFFTLGINAQTDWENYVVQKEKSPLVISVNMKYGYISRPNYKNLLMVGSQTSKCQKNGYPTEDGLKEMYVFSDSIATIIDGLTKNRLVGILTYQCKGFDVFYVKDTTNLRVAIQNLIHKNFSGYTYLKLKEDKRWKYYYENMYPKDDSEEFFINQDLLTQFVYDGDNLLTPRKITHWFYFYREKKRKKFIDKIAALDFKVESKNFKKERTYKYELQISRKDSITPNSVLKRTKTLSDFARLFYAKYDGWNAELIKKD
jgi:hypothetical protein